MKILKYAVDHTAPGIGDDFVSLAPIAAGLLVFDAWCFLPQVWATNPPGDGHTIAVSLGQGTGALVRYDGVTSNASPDSEPDCMTVNKRVQRVPANAHLCFEAYPGQGAFVSGQATVYVLVADAV